MALFRIYRETTLPGTLQPYSVYFVAPASKPNYVEIYVSDATGSSARRILNDNDIQAMIDASISGMAGIEIVADITTRDALAPTTNTMVLVLDASDDATVNSGSATYIYRVSSLSWIKIAEYESMDLILDWANIQNKPTSSIADIDDAVAKRHTHTNKTELDKIGEDGNGNFIYNGALPVIAWSSTGW